MPGHSPPAAPHPAGSRCCAGQGCACPLLAPGTPPLPAPPGSGHSPAPRPTSQLPLAPLRSQPGFPAPPGSGHSPAPSPPGWLSPSRLPPARSAGYRTPRAPQPLPGPSVRLPAARCRGRHRAPAAFGRSFARTAGTPLEPGWAQRYCWICVSHPPGFRCLKQGWKRAQTLLTHLRGIETAFPEKPLCNSWELHRLAVQLMGDHPGI